MEQNPFQDTILELDKKKIRSNYFKVVMDIILVIVLIAIFYYVYSNIEYAKMLNGDPCRICENKTGGICATQPIRSLPVRPITNYSNLLLEKYIDIENNTNISN